MKNSEKQRALFFAFIYDLVHDTPSKKFFWRNPGFRVLSRTRVSASSSASIFNVSPHQPLNFHTEDIRRPYSYYNLCPYPTNYQSCPSDSELATSSPCQNSPGTSTATATSSPVARRKSSNCSCKKSRLSPSPSTSSKKKPKTQSPL